MNIGAKITKIILRKIVQFKKEMLMDVVCVPNITIITVVNLVFLLPFLIQWLEYQVWFSVGTKPVHGLEIRRFLRVQKGS